MPIGEYLHRKIITLRETFRKLKRNSQIAFSDFIQLIKIKLEKFCQARHYLIEINQGEKFMNESSESKDVLTRLKTQVFESSNEKLALALGRPVDEIDLWFQGGEIDEDAQEKINGLAQERLAE